MFFTLRALITICILALDTKEFSNSTKLVELEAHIQTVLELAVQLIPFEEGEFLDNINELISSKKE